MLCQPSMHFVLQSHKKFSQLSTTDWLTMADSGRPRATPRGEAKKRRGASPPGRPCSTRGGRWNMEEMKI